MVLEPAPTPPPPSGPALIEQKSFGKKDGRRRAGGRTAVEELTSEEREAVTIVFHQYETGLREGTIFTKVEIEAQILLCPVSTEFKQDSWGRYTLFPSQFAFKSTDEHHFSWIGHVVNTPIRDGG